MDGFQSKILWRCSFWCKLVGVDMNGKMEKYAQAAVEAFGLHLNIFKITQVGVCFLHDLAFLLLSLNDKLILICITIVL